MPNPTLRLYGVCGEDKFGDGFTAKNVAAWLETNAAAEAIDIRINSGGGFVDDGTAIYNILAGFKGHKRVTIDGVAASMAALIAVAGDERIFGAGAMLMVHQPWNVTLGDAKKHRKQAETLEKFAVQHAGIFAERTGQSLEQVELWMANETWFDGPEALEAGFATGLAKEDIDEDKLAAMLGSVRLDFLDLKGKLPVRLARAQGFGRAVAVAAVIPEKVMPEITASAAADAANPTIVEQALAMPEGNAAERKAGVTAERARAKEIRRIVGAAKLPAEMADELIDGDIALDQARAMVIDAIVDRQEAEQPPTIKGPHATMASDGRDKWLEGAAAWVMVKAGLGGMIKQHEGALPDPGEFRGMSMCDLARDSIERQGGTVRGMERLTMVGRAFTMRGDFGPGNTTSDFPVLLENVMHKVLQAAYATQQDTWTQFCRIGSVSDFRAHNRYRIGSFGALDAVPEHAEFKRKSIPDGEKASITATTKGNIIAITRQAIINDDLSAFNDLAVMLGRAARLSIEVDVYAQFALNSGFGPTMPDTNPLFHASHNNIAGTGGAPTVVLFDEARVKLAQQLDISGNEYLDLRPSAWVGPIGLGGTVRVLNQAQYDPDTVNKLQKPNMVNGMLQTIVDTPRLSGTSWYLFANANVAPVYEVAFLDGVQEPFVDSMDGWNVDGTELKVRLDYGIAAIDYRGAVRNAGQ